VLLVVYVKGDHVSNLIKLHFSDQIFLIFHLHRVSSIAGAGKENCINDARSALEESKSQSLPTNIKHYSS
jgi:hypothetical protein